MFFGINNSLHVVILDSMLLFGLMTSGFDAFLPCFYNLDGIVMTTDVN